MEYEKLNIELYKANDKKIYEMTGCLSKCNKYAYKVWPMTDLRPIDDLEMRFGSRIWLMFYLPTGETEVREQVRKIGRT